MTNKNVRLTIPSEDKVWCVKKSNRKIRNVYPVLYLFRHQAGLKDLIIISSLVDILDLFFRQLYHNFIFIIYANYKPNGIFSRRKLPLLGHFMQGDLANSVTTGKLAPSLKLRICLLNYRFGSFRISRSMK